MKEEQQQQQQQQRQQQQHQQQHHFIQNASSINVMMQFFWSLSFAFQGQKREMQEQ